MNLTIDFNTLTMNEAEYIEAAVGLGLDAIAKRLQDENAPKMSVMKALATVAYARDNSVTLKKAAVTVGSLPISNLLEDLDVEQGDHPTPGSEQ